MTSFGRLYRKLQVKVDWGTHFGTHFCAQNPGLKIGPRMSQISEVAMQLLCGWKAGQESSYRESGARSPGEVTSSRFLASSVLRRHWRAVGLLGPRRPQVLVSGVNCCGCRRSRFLGQCALSPPRSPEGQVVTVRVCAAWQAPPPPASPDGVCTCIVRGGGRGHSECASWHVWGENCMWRASVRGSPEVWVG